MRNLLAAVIVSTAMIQGCTTAPELVQMSDTEQFATYVGNAEDSSVLTASGDCLRSIGFSSENLMVECQASSKVVEEAPVAPAPRQLARLSYDGTALFAFDSAQLSSDGRRELTNLVSKLNGNAQIGGIAVVGHADSVGSNDYNQSLSERRAAAVRQFLQSTLRDIDVVTSGMGETSPVADNSTSAGRQRNRRVEVKINAVEAEKAVFE